MEPLQHRSTWSAACIAPLYVLLEDLWIGRNAESRMAAKVILTPTPHSRRAEPDASHLHPNNKSIQHFPSTSSTSSPSPLSSPLNHNPRLSMAPRTSTSAPKPAPAEAQLSASEMQQRAYASSIADLELPKTTLTKLAKGSVRLLLPSPFSIRASSLSRTLLWALHE